MRMRSRKALLARTRQAQARFRRRLLWLLRAGLPPPDERGFAPRLEGDERPGRIDPVYEREKRAREEGRAADERAYVRPYPHCPTWSLPARADDAAPSWDNVVRALEEDR
jgi:hypothetical protein